MTLGYPQRDLLVKNHAKKRYNFTPPAAVVDDPLPIEPKAIWAACSMLRLEGSVPHQTALAPLHS